MKGIKNIILDLGAVILNIDYKLTQDAFKKLGIDHEHGFYSKQAQSNLFDQLETGKIGEKEFLKAMYELATPNTTDRELIDAWNAMILDFPLRRLQLLQQLQLHYNMFLLSNTNEIHEEYFNKLLLRACGFPTLAVFFDRIYLSHRVGLRKPNKEIFELVLSQNKLVPEDTLFIDDSLQHIESAKTLGIQTIHLLDGMSIEDDVFRKK